MNGKKKMLIGGILTLIGFITNIPVISPICCFIGGFLFTFGYLSEDK